MHEFKLTPSTARALVVPLSMPSMHQAHARDHTTAPKFSTIIVQLMQAITTLPYNRRSSGAKNQSAAARSAQFD